MEDVRRRQELEAVAFGIGATPAERRVALEALSSLGDRHRHDDPEPGGIGASSVGLHEPEGDPAGDPGTRLAFEPAAEPDSAILPGASAEAVAARFRRPRPAVALLVAAALVVGGLIGAGLATQRESSAPSASKAGASTPPPAGRTADRDPVARANALLASKSIAQDAYPTTFDLNQTFVPSSTRLVATAGSDVRIFIARQVGTNPGFCLLSATMETTGVQSSGSATCATRQEFAAHGMLLGEDTFTVTWRGGTITVELGPHP